MKRDKLLGYYLIIILGFASFISTDTSSQNATKGKLSNYKPLIVKPRPKIDTIVSKIDTVNKEQLVTKEILSDTKVQIKDNIRKNTEINEFITEVIKEDKKKTVVFDTVVAIKLDTVKVVVVEQESIVIIDTVKQERTFLQRIFKFLPFKKRRE